MNQLELNRALELIYSYSNNVCKYKTIMQAGTDYPFRCIEVTHSEREKLLMATAALMTRCLKVKVRDYQDAKCYKMVIDSTKSFEVHFYSDSGILYTYIDIDMEDINTVLNNPFVYDVVVTEYTT